MAPPSPRRSIRASTYAFFFVTFALILVFSHSLFLALPYFWDELGQFVPAALDILHDGALVPHSTVPNVHPPGVMLWLAGIWKVAGYSIPATRVAMLLIAAVGVLCAFLLAIRLSRGLGGAPAFYAVLLLLIDPLFYTQSMMAQLDMPAMALTVMALLLFLDGRHRPAAFACTVLVLVKETGIVLPFLCVCALFLRGQRRQTVWYAAPFVALAAWLALLWHTTGNLFGDPGFEHYNINYALQPVHVAAALLRRIHYLGIADGRWIGVIAIAIGWRRGIFNRPEWRFTGLFCLLHVLLVSLLGGAELERYLLPVLPVFYIATAAAWSLFPVFWRNASMAAFAIFLLLGLFINAPYPFPYENNLAMMDFVELHHSAARYVEQYYPDRTIYTAWPLTAALRRPEFGYVHHPLRTHETSDLHYSTLRRLDPAKVDVLLLYSRTWDPPWGVLRLGFVRRFLSRYYDYEPEMDAAQARDRLGLRAVMKWTQRGQWVEVCVRESSQKR